MGRGNRRGPGRLTVSVLLAGLLVTPTACAGGPAADRAAQVAPGGPPAAPEDLLPDEVEGGDPTAPSDPCLL
ncbi:hypothetical protein [Streptomyces alkaliphilus]|uniref:Uncharacterized protein n=1 Tax=Streptomyces alkaliphilus TaxID=1472722 RepID=A0A646IHZ6_9ACTN|nr:hypothetical protein [Streptomyces alkaliphilus]MQS10508.1 hypothetical protein [Streptomyces alkaliphilus]